MIKVEKLEKNKIKNLVSDENPSYSGIVAGECNGSLWVDDMENPTLALAYSFAVGGYCILGNPKKESTYEQFQNFLINDLFPKFKNENINGFEFSVESKETEIRILEMFSDRKMESEDELLHIQTDRTELEKQIPSGYSITKVNSKFVDQLENGEYLNKEFLEERLLESWGSYQNFLDKSLAFVVIHQKRIEAVIVGTARFNNIIPIDIETEKQHRKKGLASILTQRFVNECMDNQLVAQWNCMDSNEASRKTAQKAGFNFLKKSPVYWFYF